MDKVNKQDSKRREWTRVINKPGDIQMLPHSHRSHSSLMVTTDHLIAAR